MSNEKEYTTPVYVALPIAYAKELDKLSEKYDISRSDFIREAVRQFLERKEEEAAE